MPRHRNKEYEKKVLNFLAKHPLTFAQVGDMLGVSRQYIHQVYKRAEVEGRNTERYPIISVKNHRVNLCDTCQNLIKIFGKYEVISRDALGRKLGIPRKKIPYHLQRLKELNLVPDSVMFFNSERMAKAWISYKESDIPILQVGSKYGYKNLYSRIDRMGKKGIDISRHPDQNVKALLS